MRGAFVHGIGMEEPISLVGIDAEGCVVSSGVLEPRRLALVGGAFWVLELPWDEPTPPVGAKLRMRRGS